MEKKNYYYHAQTGKTIEMPFKLGKFVDPETGKEVDGDINRQAAIAKGLIPYQKMIAPTSGKEAWVNENVIDSARNKGLMYDYEWERFQTEEPTALQGRKVPEQYVRAVATKEGISFEQADQMVERAGLQPEYRESKEVRRALSSLGEGVALGVPQFLSKKLLMDEKEERAFDDLRELGGRSEATLEKGVEVGAAVAGGLALPFATASRLKGVAGAAVGGGVEMVATSKQGEEAKDLAIGAALGAGLGMGGIALGKAARAIWGKNTDQLVENSAKAEKALDDVITADTGLSINRHIDDLRMERKDLIDVEDRYIRGEAIEDDELINIANDVKASKFYKENEKLLEGFDDKELTQTYLEEVKVDLANKMGGDYTFFSPKAKQAAMLNRRYADLMNNKPQMSTPDASGKPFDKKAAKKKYNRAMKNWNVKVNQLKKERDFSAQQALASRAKTLKQVDEHLALQMQQRGPAEFAAVNKARQDQKLAHKLLASYAAKKMPEEFEGIKRVADILTDGKFVARMIDRRNGLDVEHTIMKMENKHSFFTTVFNAKLGELNEINGRIAKVATNDFNGANIRKFVENDVEGLDSTQQEIVKDIRQWFEEVRVQANDAFGFDIKKYENRLYAHYFPHKSKRIAQRIPLIKKQLTLALRAGERPSNVSYRELTDADLEALRLSDEGQQLIQAVEVIGQKKVRDVKGFVEAYERSISLSDELMERTRMEAAPLFKREEGLPEFLLENDLRVAGANWVQSIYKQGFMGEELANLRRAADIAKSIGDNRAYRFLDNLIQDSLGVRAKSIAGRTRQMSTKLEVVVNAAADKSQTVLGKAFWGTMKDAMNFFPTASMMPYANFLGMSPRALIMNMSQLPTLTVPELGGAVSPTSYFKSNVKLIKLLTKGTTFKVTDPGLLNKLSKMNLSVSQFDPKTGMLTTKNPELVLANDGLVNLPLEVEHVNVLRAGLEHETKAFKGLQKFSEQYAHWALYLYGKTESLNRFMASEMAMDLVDNFVKGQGKATKYVQSVMTPDVSTKFQRLLKTDERAARKLMKEYVLSKTVFNYSRYSLSEYGRSMGPLFSMFTKWPTSILGDVRDTMSQQGISGSEKVRRLGARYMAPLGALWITSVLVDRAMGEDDPIKKELFGSKGPVGWAPITSIEAFAGGEFIQTPALEAATGLVSSVLKADPVALGKTLDESFNALAPGQALIRFFAEDLPRWSGEDAETYKIKLFEPVGRAISGEAQEMRKELTE